MADFIMCIVQYVVIGALLLAVGGVGAFIGIKMRKSSDAKKAAAAATEEQRLNSSVMSCNIGMLCLHEGRTV